VRGSFVLICTLGLCGCSTYSFRPTPREYPRRVTDIFLLENSATPTQRRRASVSPMLQVFALERPRLLPLLHSYFFSRGGFEFGMGGKKAGRASCNEQEAVGMKYKCSGAFVHTAMVMRPAHGVHPRHPPRTFPLGLLAPRCLGSLRFLALPPCGAGARARICLGEGRHPSPSFGLLLAVVG